jgi:outer membrane lipoprotein-sorting protein
MFQIHGRRRWAVPAIALAAILGGAAIPSLLPSASASTPDLPPLTPAELLSKVRTAQAPPLSGTLTLTSNLGLPSLSSLGTLGSTAGTSVTDLLSGSHSARVWFDGPQHVRVTTSAPMQETNIIRNGTDVWRYDSTTQTATHTTLTTGADTSSIPSSATDTPAAFAQHLLAEVTPSTDVTVASPRYVAGQAVYELVLTPKSSNSTIGHAIIAVDAATGVPLDVRLTARANGATAFEFGFTRVNFSKPAASLFKFTPPPGSRVVQAQGTTGLLSPDQPFRERRFRHRVIMGAPGQEGPPVVGLAPTNKVTSVGTDWTTVAVTNRFNIPAPLGSMLNNAPAVTAGSHSGKLITSTLLNAIVLDDGRVAVGAVTPAALKAAVATLP